MILIPRRQRDAGIVSSYSVAIVFPHKHCSSYQLYNFMIRICFMSIPLAKMSQVTKGYASLRTPVAKRISWSDSIYCGISLRNLQQTIKCIAAVFRSTFYTTTPHNFSVTQFNCYQTLWIFYLNRNKRYTKLSFFLWPGVSPFHHHKIQTITIILRMIFNLHHLFIQPKSLLNILLYIFQEYLYLNPIWNNWTLFTSSGWRNILFILVMQNLQQKILDELKSSKICWKDLFTILVFQQSTNMIKTTHIMELQRDFVYICLGGLFIMGWSLYCCLRYWYCSI